MQLLGPCNLAVSNLSATQMSLMIGLSVERDLIPRHNSVIPNSVCKMYPLYTGLSQQFTITIGQSFCFDVFGNDNESVIGVCNSLCILFDLGISVQLWAIIPVLVLIPLLLKKILLQWIMHGLSMITGNLFLC